MKSSWISVRALLEAAELAGVARRRLCDAARIDTAELSDEYGWIEGERYEALLYGAVALTNCRAFGLRWGASAHLLQFELAPLLVATAPTLRASLDVTSALHGILHERPQMTFHSSDDVYVVRCESDFTFSPTARRVMTDLSMIGVKRLIEYCCRGLLPDRVQFDFSFDPGESTPEYSAVFGSQVAFAAPQTEVRFPAELLELANPTHNKNLHQLMHTQFLSLCKRMANKLSYVEHVRSEHCAALPRLREMPEVARALGLSERSLRRKLTEEGTTFTDVVDSVQIERAQRLLSNPNVSVKEVASELGFESTSGFHRAFKRRTGVTPSAFRISRGM